MIKNSKKAKKTTSKYRDFKISPLISIIAVVEVLVLIAVSTFAWFTFSTNKSLDSGTISVEADSGLDIDFSTATVDDYINIWNYIDKDFKFEPVTSLDGRNVFVPTSGTFESQDTGSMVFRDGTVNDINSKYINIDFELTNTSDIPVDVYLNNKSFFKVRDTSNNLEESRALRLAFYTNDGNSGNVGSSLINNSSNGSTDGTDDSSMVDENAFTVYFDNSSANWDNIYAYFYDSDDGSSPEYQTAWPGVKMSRASGKTYSVTITNPSSSHGVKYDKLIFNNGSGTQSSTFSLTGSTKDYVYKTNSSGSTSSGYPRAYSAQTVYFVKPKSWNNVYCHAFDNSNGTAYTTWPGDEMKYVGSGIYSYTYNSSNTGQILFDNGSSGGTNQTRNFSPVAGKVYYCDGSTVSSGSEAGRYIEKQYSDYAALTYNTVYFFNTYGWTNPYASVSLSTSDSINAADLAMVSLSGNVYYCTIPSIYDKVYFRDKNQGNNADLRSEKATISSGKVYRPVDDKNSSGQHYLESFNYSTYIQKEGYPVISPGVSVGFQRSYSPVVNINSVSGAATEVVPAFSNSIDNYIYGSGTPVFSIEPKHMVSLSMVLWLEGTDEATFDSTYPANKIDLRLEFATVTRNDLHTPGAKPVALNTGESGYYTYNFYDRTREIWTSDRQATESGITVAPVMQLYDNTIKRGYLMHATERETYDGKKKVSCWSVEAPPSIATLGHDIIFRRVNPYNEDEVWNYWHAGRVAGAAGDIVYETIDDAGSTRYTPYSIATSGSGDNLTISFTAFADGSPLSTMSGLSKDTDSTYKVPDVSCGGLWGDHNVRTVSVYDGLRGQPLGKDNGVLTVNYYYTYTGGGKSRQAHIEYKASTGDYSFYYFVMPNVAYANNIACCFKRYTGFDGSYAINSAENNPNITFVDYYGKGQTVSGDYFELNQLTGGTNTDYSYWGSDMLYIQTNVDTKSFVYTSSSKDDNNAKLFQVHFMSSDGDRYAYLYYNGNFNPDGSGDGYACVVPNDRSYSSYRLENCSFDGIIKYNVSENQTIKHASSVRITDPLNSSTYRDMLVNYLEQNGITTTYIGIRIYLQTNKQGWQQDPHCYLYSASNGAPTGWPGYGMTPDGSVNSNGTTLYKYYYDFNVSKYEKLKFNYWTNGTEESQELVFNMNDVKNNMIYEAKNTAQVTRVDSSTDNVTLKTANDWTASAWPHLTFKS